MLNKPRISPWRRWLTRRIAFGSGHSPIILEGSRRLFYLGRSQSYPPSVYTRRAKTLLAIVACLHSASSKLKSREDVSLQSSDSAPIVRTWPGVVWAQTILQCVGCWEQVHQQGKATNPRRRRESVLPEDEEWKWCPGGILFCAKCI